MIRSSRFTKLRVIFSASAISTPERQVPSQALPPIGSLHSTDQRRVWPLCWRPLIGRNSSCGHTALQGHRDVDGDGLAIELPILPRDLALTSHAACAFASVVRSCSTRVCSPSARNRTRMPSRDRSTRSTSNRTMRACSAGNSSSQRGAEKPGGQSPQTAGSFIFGGSSSDCTYRLCSFLPLDAQFLGRRLR